MLVIIEALAPVFFLILFGHWLKRGQLVPDDFWGPVERLTYHLFFPCLLLHRMMVAEALGALQVLPVGSALFLAVLGCAAAMFAGRHLVGSGPAFTSALQGAIRINTYVALAAVAALDGEPGLTLLAIGIGAVVPLVNVISVAALVIYAGEGKPSVWRVASGVFRNPLFIAVIAGGSLNAIGITHVPVWSGVIDILGRASLPLGLLAVGAGIEGGRLTGGWRALTAPGLGPAMLLSFAIKLLLFPLLTLMFALVFGVGGLTLDVALLLASVPTSASAYVLAREMGGDHRLMAHIITGQTVLAAITMPLLLLLGRSLL